MVENYIPLSGSYLEGIKNFLNLERKKKSDLREVVGVLRYIIFCGIQWRVRPACYSKWKNEYYYFSKWAGMRSTLRPVGRIRILS
jgi:transposase